MFQEILTYPVIGIWKQQENTLTSGGPHPSPTGLHPGGNDSNDAVIWGLGSWSRIQWKFPESDQMLWKRVINIRQGTEVVPGLLSWKAQVVPATCFNAGMYVSIARPAAWSRWDPAVHEKYSSEQCQGGKGWQLLLQKAFSSVFIIRIYDS